MSGDLRYDGRVVVVTGAGNGLGRDYALFFGKRGAKVVVNDLGGSTSGGGASHSAADVVVEEIKKSGGQAVANYDSVEFGDKIIKTAVDAFGKVDIVINNAGILRDVSFGKMSQQDWDLIYKVHLHGPYQVNRAAWNIMRKQNYGRIINTSSSAGIFGNFGQVNYCTAKAGLHGMTLALAKEGEKKNILVNTICPMAGSRLTQNTFPQEVFDALKTDYVVPVVAYLCHESSKDTGQLIELGGGWVSKLRWSRTRGAQFDLPFTPEQVRDNWSQVGDFTNSDAPQMPGETYLKIQENLDRIEEQKKNNLQPVQTQSSLKAEQIFGLMRTFLDRGEGKTSVTKVQAIFVFEILKEKGSPVSKVWTIDMKNGQGSVQEGKSDKVDATFVMTDDDFEAVCLGKLQPQNAFMNGKMKIKGNMAKATLFTPSLFPPPTPENYSKYANPKL